MALALTELLPPPAGPWGVLEGEAVAAAVVVGPCRVDDTVTQLETVSVPAACVPEARGEEVMLGEELKVSIPVPVRGAEGEGSSGEGVEEAQVESEGEEVGESAAEGDRGGVAVREGVEVTVRVGVVDTLVECEGVELVHCVAEAQKVEESEGVEVPVAVASMVAVVVPVGEGVVVRVAVAQRLGDGVEEGDRRAVRVAAAGGEGVEGVLRVRVGQEVALALRQAEGDGVGVKASSPVAETEKECVGVALRVLDTVEVPVYVESALVRLALAL